MDARGWKELREAQGLAAVARADLDDAANFIAQERARQGAEANEVALQAISPFRRRSRD
jgi:hypothetical protein